MRLSKDQILILESILNTHCKDNKTITRKDVYKLFEQQQKSGLEQYLFEIELSEAINTKQIKGYQIKVGRNGGITKEDLLEEITIIHSLGQHSGYITQKTLQLIFKEINHETYRG
jgi:hypothetical protein